MNHDREYSQTTTTSEAATDLDVTPGRATRTDHLKGPNGILASGLLSRKARDSNGVADGAEEAVGAASSSSGSALPDTLMRKFESSLGTDLSSVRVHTGDSSAAANEAVGARAYTMGQDIHFAAGQYDPSSAGGQHLLAHEVAHTVQQSGMTQRMQFKLAVSSPGDHLEHEADRAADAMIAGARATVSGGGGLGRKVFRETEPSVGTIQGAGDEAEAKAKTAVLQVDSVSVQTDRSRVGELIADIEKQKTNLTAAEKDDSSLEGRYAPLATNTKTKANLDIFNEKLDVSNVDTTAFAVQYRTVYGDYSRLTAEATEALGGAKSADPLAAAGDKVAKHDIAMGAAQAGLERFRAARANMNTAGKKMDAQLTSCRGSADLLRGAVYKVRASAAAAAGKDAAKKLAAVKKEIEDVAAGVGKVVKLCSGVAGLAGGAGETNKLAAPHEAKSVEIEAGRSGLRGATNVDVDPAATSKAELLKAMGADISGLAGGGGGAAGIAVALVKAIGTYANKGKIASLEAAITKAAAEESSFTGASEASNMIGHQEQMEASSKQLSLLLEAFSSARQEMNDASAALMAELSKGGGAKGKDQAKAVLFLTDSDRFLAQVNNAISIGDNQQANLKQAATDRKSLRGTTAAVEGGKDSKTQFYYRVSKIQVPGKIYGTNDAYQLHKVDVTFQDGGMGVNGINQGGAGSVEGTGSADDEVARKVELLKKAKDQVTVLQKKVQAALGMGAAGVNA
jgi:hypothetical protein